MTAIQTLKVPFSLPTDIQAEGIPMILGGGDVLMAAETGSGKTGVRASLPFLTLERPFTCRRSVCLSFKSCTKR